MREIKYIVVHHSGTPRDLDIYTSLSSFNQSHKKRLTGMTHSGTEWGYIAYHYCISSDGQVVQTRLDDRIGFHASNWTVNQHSIGICLLGNFDKEKPTEFQVQALEQLISEISKQYKTIESVNAHRDFARKTCPGLNLDDKYIDSLNLLLSPYEPVESFWRPSSETQLKIAVRAYARTNDPARKRALARRIKRLRSAIGQNDT